MPKFLALIAILLLLFFILRFLRAGYLSGGRSFLIRAGLAILALTMIVLAIAGKVHWLGALLAGTFAALQRLLPALLGFALRFWPWVRVWLEQRNARKNMGQATAEGTLSRTQAMEILGLKEGASRAEIIAAHRKLMQKMHPDQGGSNYLAHQLNSARDLLLEDFPE